MTSTASAPHVPGAGSGRSNRLGFWAVAYAFLAVMTFSALPTPLYVLYQQQDGFSSFMVTVVFGAYAVGVAASLFLVGHLSDWHGRRRVTVPALALCIVSGAIFLLWHGLGALLVARVLCGLAVGALTATATAWIGELHAADRPGSSQRRPHAADRPGSSQRLPQLVATAANLGGIGLGPLVSGVLAQWAGHPLTTPYVVSIASLALAIVLVALSPETRERVVPRPRCHPQRVSVPRASRARYLSACVGTLIAFAAFGLFTSLAPTFLAGTLHHGSRALAGAATFAVFAAAVTAQAAVAARAARDALAAGIGVLLAGLAVLAVAVWLPSLALFLVGGVLAGAGGGMLFKGSIATVAALAVPERRAEALAGTFLAGYIGLAVPVMGLGVLTEVVAPRVGLLVFAGVLTVAIGLATPTLVGRGPGAAATVAA